MHPGRGHPSVYRYAGALTSEVYFWSVLLCVEFGKNR